MATSTKNKSTEKEKRRASSTPNLKPSPHYLKPTISFAMDVCTYPATKHAANAPSDDTSTLKHFSHSARKSIDNKSPSPSQLKKTLSVSPKSTKLFSSSPPSRRGISPRSVPERGFKTPTAKRNGKEEPSTKGTSVKKSINNATTNGKEEQLVKGAGVKKNTNSTTRPKTGTKATTSTTTTTSPKKKKLVKRKEGEKATPVKEIQEEVVELVEEKTIQVESPPSHDQSCLSPTDNSELKNANSFDSTILSEDDELVASPKEDNEESLANKDEVTEEPEQITNEEANIQGEPKVEDKEKEVTEDETIENGVSNHSPSSAEDQAPHKLKFRQGKQLEEKQQGEGLNLQRIKFKDRKETTETSTKGLGSNGQREGESESVVLKKQDVQEKKESPVSNDVIEETASKLVEKKKSKVKALVGAFETVMNVDQEPEE